MTHDTSRWLAALLLLSTVGAAGATQVCRNDIQSSAPDAHFTNNGNGTVTDAATGLMWKQCAEGLSGVGCASGTASRFIWAQALRLATDANFAGYADWRLPNKNELESLVEWRCFNPAINTKYFPNTPADLFYSASPYANNSFYAWFVHFNSGYVNHYLTFVYTFVRLVRGGQ